MNDSLPANCKSVREHLDAYLSGEISSPASEEVSTHLSTCTQCMAELDLRRKLRESLRGAVQRSPVPPFLEARIRRSLETKKTGRTSLWIWAPGFALAALLAVAFLASWIGQRPVHPWETAKADQATFIEALYGEVASIMRVGLGDHVHCTYFRKFPKDVPTPEALVEKIGPQYAPLLPAVREQAPAGSQILLAHQCVFRDRSFIHIALEDRGKLLSLVITRKQPGEQLDARAGSLGTGSGAGIYQASAEQFAIAAFDAGDFLAFVVSDHKQYDNAQWAANLASPVRKVLAGTEG
jgi:anti-sigma factor (TIGR02949 family)